MLDAVLVEGLEDHVAGAVCCVACAADRRLAVIAGVAAEAALVDFAFRGAVEGKAHLFEVEHGVDGFFCHDFGCVLVDEVVAALNGVEGVPFPVVLFDVGQCGAHAALCRAGVGAGGVDLCEHCGACTLAGFDGCAHAGAASSDDHNVIVMYLHKVSILLSGGQAWQKLGSSDGSAPVGQGLKVKITRVPSTTMIADAT